MTHPSIHKDHPYLVCVYDVPQSEQVNKISVSSQYRGEDEERQVNRSSQPDKMTPEIQQWNRGEALIRCWPSAMELSPVLHDYNDRFLFNQMDTTSSSVNRKWSLLKADVQDEKVSVLCCACGINKTAGEQLCFIEISHKGLRNRKSTKVRVFLTV